MSATELLAVEFDDAVRRRGERYFNDSLVQITRMDSRRLTARVYGNSVYKVTLRCIDFDDLQWECTCPYDWGNCKHVWATLLAAKAKGWEPLAGFSDDEQRVGVRPLSTPAKRMQPAPAHKPVKEPVARWKTELNRIKSRMSQMGNPLMLSQPPAPQPWPSQREICYVIDVGAMLSQQEGLVIEVMAREPKKNGQPGKWKREHPGGALWSNAPEDDRLIGQMLTGCGDEYGYSYSSANRFRIDESKYQTILRRIGQTGRCRLRELRDQQPGDGVTWDDAAPWTFQMEVRKAAGSGYELVGSFQRAADNGNERMALSEPRIITVGGLLIAQGKISRVDHRGAFELLALLREKSALPLAKNALPELLKTLCEMPRLPKVNWPEDFEVNESEPTPRPILKIRAPRNTETSSLFANLTFNYDGGIVAEHEQSDAIFNPADRRVIRRNRPLESQSKELMHQLGFRTEWNYARYGRPVTEWRLPVHRLSPAVMQLTREGWHVEADGKLFRSGGEIRIEVASGIDWFDLNGRAQFGDTGVALPKLLSAVEKGQNTVVLDDGTIGIVPEAWLNKYAPLVQMGQTQGDAIRFTPAQVGFLDALLAAMPEARCDQAFDRVREELSSFAGIAPADTADGFAGELRDYQKEGLGWLEFLQKFNFGGCLADDMGLGKTVQVLALLHRRREAGKGTSLAVVPRSLIFNWKQEAARFTPDLRVLDQTGGAKARDSADFDRHDLVLTTYGTLRRNITSFKDFDFDYVILDESQAIKNAMTQSAKAARLLRGRHRLALSGTPIENHLGELWSLFEFLNPKMLGSAGVFRNLIQSNGQVDAAGKSLLASALRPFILRRTKSQVARELPEKIEQTIVCPLQGEQRKLYDELKDHYRASLLGLIEKNGIARSKIQILEALLRLRQAACHPGLIDKSRADEGSSKLQALLANLSEIVSEGHKVLVFSQFTSLLALVRKALDKERIVYEYLDGKTRDRQAKVERFQSDPQCPVFLISLKAGGVGLNLTAAEYVFLLDPWWNPAVEAQAVDRAHRIGQSRTVFAYRLIAKDTVEDKILELQKSKRDLADAIITEDNSVIAKMGTDELRMLLA